MPDTHGTIVHGTFHFEGDTCHYNGYVDDGLFIGSVSLTSGETRVDYQYRGAEPGMRIRRWSTEIPTSVGDPIRVAAYRGTDGKVTHSGWMAIRPMSRHYEKLVLVASGEWS